MTTYLAQIDKRGMALKSRLLLLMQRKSELHWGSVLPAQFVLLPSHYQTWHEGMLTIAEVDDKKGVVSLTPAIPTLVGILQDLSKCLLQANKQEDNIKLWRESLEFQAANLFARGEDMDRREELLRHREKQVQELLKNLKN